MIRIYNYNDLNPYKRRIHNVKSNPCTHFYYDKNRFCGNYASRKILRYNRKCWRHNIGTCSKYLPRLVLSIISCIFLKIALPIVPRQCEQFGIIFQNNIYKIRDNRLLKKWKRFAGMDGTLYDYFHGYDDLKKRRVVFVGDARKRIQEDYLRILRYFRFFGKISCENSHHDNDIIEAIKENGSGLANISGERIWMELSSILSGNFWGELMETIVNCGLAPHMGLPKEPDVPQFLKLYKDVKNVPLRPITKITGLIKTENQFSDLNKRLKLSSFDRDLGFFVVNHREDNINLRWCKYKTIMLQQRTKLSNLQDWIQEILKYKSEKAVLYEYSKWDVPKFPINGGMLKEHGIPMDKNTAKVLNMLKEYWIDQDCAVDAKQILTQLPSVLEEIKNTPKKA